MRRRNRHISVWMNDKEYSKLKKEAKAAGLGIDPFIRNLVAGVEIKPKPPEEYAKLLYELSAIGNNINQIAYWANYRKGPINVIKERFGRSKLSCNSFRQIFSFPKIIIR